MKIGMVCYPSLGGSGVVATELGQQLAEQGHEIHFITYELPFRLSLKEANIFFHEVEINRYDLFKYPDYALPLAVKMACVAEECQLDILHVHYAIPHATSALLAKQILHHRKKPAVITTLHGTDITLVGKDPSYHQVVKLSIERSDGITAVSQSLKNQTVEIFNLKHPIEVIYNFTVPQKQLIGKKTLRELFVRDNEKVLIQSSNFRSVKCPKDVLTIFMLVRKLLPCKLLFLGSGDEIVRLRQMVSQNHLEKEVFFLGQSRDVAPYVSSADLFLLPSSQESFGLAALEAMSYGLPVIASNVGGIPEVVEHGKTGWLAACGDVEKMASYTIKTLSDQKLYREMSKNAVRLSAEKFSVSKILPQYIDFYEKFY
jgi:N-acetyl-alpha-D-glucosaminyl L-malate synthase BshA